MRRVLWAIAGLILGTVLGALPGGAGLPVAADALAGVASGLALPGFVVLGVAQFAPLGLVLGAAWSALGE